MNKPDRYETFCEWLEKRGLPIVPRDVYEKELRKIPEGQSQNADIILMKDRSKKRASSRRATNL